jgi:hypothetical protein
MARVDDGECLSSASIRRADVTAIKGAGKMPFDFAQDKPVVRNEELRQPEEKVESLTSKDPSFIRVNVKVSYMKARPFGRSWNQLC